MIEYISKVYSINIPLRGGLKMNKKHFIIMVLAFVVMATTSLGFMTEPVHAEGTSNSVNITIMGTSDVHGRFVPWDYSLDSANTSGSLTQIYTAVKQIRQSNPNTILVDAGDSIQDNSVEMFNKGPEQPMVTGMNKMGYDIWNMGNHEFNFGLDVLSNVTSQFKGKLLGGNIYKSDGTRYLPAYTIVEKDGVKIGFIGMDTPLVPSFEQGTNHVTGLEFRDPVLETKKAISELNGKVDAIVGIMHMGEDNENAILNSGVKDIANACPELTAIIAGHMHKLVKSDTVNGVLITEPYKYGQDLSKIDLIFEKKDGKYVVANKKADVLAISSYASDKDLETILKPFNDAARADANTVIGQLIGMNMVPKNEIVGIPEVQVGETPLTDFFNEVQLYYSKADVVAISFDNDKAALNVGPIKKKDISYNYQYALGETSVYKVTGKELKTYMEWSAGYFNSVKSGDITISFNPLRRASKYSTNDIFGGIKYNIDLTEPQGSRIRDFKRLDGTAIKDEDILRLGMNSYRLSQLTAKGGPLEGKTFERLWYSTSLTAFGETDGIIRNMAIKYIKEVKNGVVTAVNKGNWKVLGVDRTSDIYKQVATLVNSGKIKIQATSDGLYTNVASININDIPKDLLVLSKTDNTSLVTTPNTTEVTANVLPQTGTFIDFSFLIALGLFLSILGCLVIKKKA